MFEQKYCEIRKKSHFFLFLKKKFVEKVEIAVYSISDCMDNV